jgi:hypothetical protein
VFINKIFEFVMLIYPIYQYPRTNISLSNRIICNSSEQFCGDEFSYRDTEIN